MGNADKCAHLLKQSLMRVVQYSYFVMRGNMECQENYLCQGIGDPGRTYCKELFVRDLFPLGNANVRINLPLKLSVLGRQQYRLIISRTRFGQPRAGHLLTDNLIAKNYFRGLQTHSFNVIFHSLLHLALSLTPCTHTSHKILVVLKPKVLHLITSCCAPNTAYFLITIQLEYTSAPSLSTVKNKG